MKHIFFIAILIFFMSCEKKSVKLPTICIKGETDLYNYSQIWAFYNINKGDTTVKINQNNTISTTHWVLNIDRRLTMYDVAKVITLANNKRAKKNIHSSKEMHNYLNYANPQLKTNSLYLVDSLSFISKSYNDIINKEDVIILLKDSIMVSNNKISSKELNLKILQSIDKHNIKFGCLESIKYQNYLKHRLLIDSLLKNKKIIEPSEILIKY